eukprot:7812739-Pyramimonas_sp.AAC.3
MYAVGKSRQVSGGVARARSRFRAQGRPAKPTEPLGKHNIQIKRTFRGRWDFQINLFQNEKVRANKRDLGSCGLACRRSSMRARVARE